MEMLLPIARVPARSVRPAPRPQGLAGQAIGLLSNNKPNADLLLSRLGAALSAGQATGPLSFQNKGTASRPAPEPMLETLAGTGLVINAVGD